MNPRTIVVLEGDQTGQELLEAAVRVLQPDVLGLEREEFQRSASSLASRATARKEPSSRGSSSASREHSALCEGLPERGRARESRMLGRASGFRPYRASAQGGKSAAQPHLPRGSNVP